MKVIIKRPIITEKSLTLYRKYKIAMYEVDLTADKNSIKSAMSVLYPSIEIQAVRTTIRLGKIKYSRLNKSYYRTKHKKLAFIKIKKGDIDEFNS
ncbi:MAG: 50S ribosomal protein L23 [Candidatus Dojkabacteria bacterium]|nr:50S ribosomal protein L23 [Candidatus Dojkabacteria bacterium]